MSSVKNRKSKSRGIFGCSGQASSAFNGEYQLRREEFSELPPAKVVQPLQQARRKLAEAQQIADRKLRALLAANPGADFAYLLQHASKETEEVQYAAIKVATMQRYAKVGNGAMVRVLH